MHNNYFIGYIGTVQNEIVALSIGMKKPWIKGMEYYIDQFCVAYDYQGKGIGSIFLTYIISDIKNESLNAIILNTEKNYPAEKFYLKNGFIRDKELVILYR